MEESGLPTFIMVIAAAVMVIGVMVGYGGRYLDVYAALAVLQPGNIRFRAVSHGG